METLLQQRPIRLYEIEQRGENIVRVIVPRFGGGMIGRFLARMIVNNQSSLNLDEFGSFVYERCDGQMEVREIAGMLRERFGEKVEPLEPRLITFLQDLFKRHMITFASNE